MCTRNGRGELRNMVRQPLDMRTFTSQTIISNNLIQQRAWDAFGEYKHVARREAAFGVHADELRQPSAMSPLDKVCTHLNQSHFFKLDVFRDESKHQASGGRASLHRSPSESARKAHRACLRHRRKQTQTLSVSLAPTGAVAKFKRRVRSPTRVFVLQPP